MQTSLSKKVIKTLLGINLPHKLIPNLEKSKQLI